MDTLHTYRQYSGIIQERLELLPPGGRMGDLPRHLWHESFVRVGEKKTGGPNLRLLRLRREQPSHTITAFIFNKFVHPNENRYLTPREAACIQGFPNDFIFEGTITSAQRQIGNAVPVALGRAAAKIMHDLLTPVLGNKKIKALSLFSGAGGMDIGFSEYFEIAASIEYDHDCCETLRANFPNIKVIEDSICNIDPKQFKNDNIKFVFGGPPCQAFSAAGKQNGIKDERGQLIFEFIRYINEIQPDGFVMENVPGLLGNEKGGTVQNIHAAMEEAGYLTKHFLLCAADYGAPQVRNRLMFFGIHKKHNITPEAPEITHAAEPNLLGLKPYITVGEVLAKLPKAKIRSS